MEGGHWMSRFLSGEVMVRSKVSKPKRPHFKSFLCGLSLPGFFWMGLCPSPLGSALWGFHSMSGARAEKTAGLGDSEIRKFLGECGKAY